MLEIHPLATGVGDGSGVEWGYEPGGRETHVAKAIKEQSKRRSETRFKKKKSGLFKGFNLVISPSQQ